MPSRSHSGRETIWSFKMGADLGCGSFDLQLPIDPAKYLQLLLFLMALHSMVG